MAMNDKGQATVIPAQPGWMREVYALHWDDDSWDKPALCSPIIAWEISPPSPSLGGHDSFAHPVSIDRLDDAVSLRGEVCLLKFCIYPPGSPFFACRNDGGDVSINFASRADLMAHVRHEREEHLEFIAAGGRMIPAVWLPPAPPAP